MSNPNYDFSSLCQVVNALAMDIMFCQLPTVSGFLINQVPQSSIYLNCLKSVCHYLGWSAFYNDVLDFISLQGLLVTDYDLLTDDNPEVEQRITLILEESKLFQINLQRRQQVHLIDQSVSVESKEDDEIQQLLLAEESIRSESNQVSCPKNLNKKLIQDKLKQVESMHTASTSRSSMERA